jgi:hypothetical protein
MVGAQCNLTDAYEVGFQIWDVTGGTPGTQIFPTTPGTWEDVTAAPGRFDVGSYHAYDNTNSQGWTPDLGLNVGTHVAKWRWKITSSAPYQANQEEFEILHESQGSADSSSVITVEELKTFYLFGLDLTDDAGNEMPDTLYQHFIDSAIDWVEKKLDIAIAPKSITEERHDFYRDDYNSYIFLEANLFPVIHVEEVRFVLPSEEEIYNFDIDWIHLQREAGQINIVPGAGSASTLLMGAAGHWLPYIYGRNKFIPDAFRIKYKAGFGTPTSNFSGVADPRLDCLPKALKDVVGMIASFGPLNIAGDLLGGAGIASQSIGIDGLSQSFNTTSSATNAGYGARLVQYNKQLKDMIPTLIRYYKGLRIRVV